MADTTHSTRRAATAVLRPGTVTGLAGLQALGLLGFMSDAGAQGAAGGDGGDGGEGSGEDGGEGQGGEDGGEGGEGEGGEENPNASKATDPKTAAARDEAAQNRIKAREAEERATAAEKARDELVQALGKHLGLVNDDDGESKVPDADSLTQSLATEKTEKAEAQRELAVYKAAGTIADPERLLDSRRFLSSISEIDPTDGDAIKAAVKAAVEADSNLAPRQVRGASTADTAGGPGGGSAPKAEIGLQAALGNHYGTN